MGIKGASIMFLHSPFNIVKGIAIDSLHTLFLGVVKDLLKHWFDKSITQEHWHQHLFQGNHYLDTMFMGFLTGTTCYS